MRHPGVVLAASDSNAVRNFRQATAAFNGIFDCLNRGASHDYSGMFVNLLRYAVGNVGPKLPQNV